MYSLLQVLALLVGNFYVTIALNPICCKRCILNRLSEAGEYAVKDAKIANLVSEGIRQNLATSAAYLSQSAVLRTCQNPSSCVAMAETPHSFSAEDMSRIERLRRELEDAEEEMVAESEHAKKFMWRGQGLRHDFANARPARRRALLTGTIENERALRRAVKDAEAAGLAQEFLEDAIRVANQLGRMREELQGLLSAEDMACLKRLRNVLNKAEEEMMAEAEHCKKFMWRGMGLHHDFAKSQRARQRALLKGAIDNEQALRRAVEEAEAAGLAPEYRKDAVRTLSQLGILRAELQDAYNIKGISSVRDGKQQN